MVRVSRIVSNEGVVDQKLVEMSTKFVKRGYAKSSTQRFEDKEKAL